MRLLSRQSGASDAPMASGEAVPFQAPPSLAVEVDLPNRGRMQGLAIRKGVTLIGKFYVYTAPACQLSMDFDTLGTRRVNSAIMQ